MHFYNIIFRNMDFCQCINYCFCALFVRHCTQKTRCSARVVPCDVLQWHRFLNCNTISKFSWTEFLMLVFCVKWLLTWKKIHVWPNEELRLKFLYVWASMCRKMEMISLFNFWLRVTIGIQANFFWGEAEPFLPEKYFNSSLKNCYGNLQNYFAQLTPPNNY